MVNAALPQIVVQMLASSQMRDSHATWHFVRERWHAMPAAERQPFIARHWQPPRLNPRANPGEPPAPARDAGSGLDFLFMHRRMIAAVNTLLVQAADPAYPAVVGWAPIPWSHIDPAWPMPPNYPNGPPLAKDQTVTTRWQTEVTTKFESDAWLRSVTLDTVGATIEGGIHNWMHMHWASEPWFKSLPGQNRDDPKNDFLGSTYSSHVNIAFWKLHGWIDGRIRQWETTNNTSADFSQSWEGPSHHMHNMAGHPMSANPSPALLNDRQRREADSFFARGNLVPQ